MRVSSLVADLRVANAVEFPAACSAADGPSDAFGAVREADVQLRDCLVFVVGHAPSLPLRVHACSAPRRAPMSLEAGGSVSGVWLAAAKVPDADGNAYLVMGEVFLLFLLWSR